MLYRRKGIIESDGYKSLTTTKDLIHAVKVEYDDYWYGALFGEKNLNLSLKHGVTTITLDEKNYHKLPYRYIEINDQPAFYILPKKQEEIGFFENDWNIIPKMYGITIIDWLQDHHNKVFLINLHETISFISSQVNEIVNSMDICREFDYDDIPDKIKDKIKDAFIEHYYDDTFYNIIEVYGHEILKDIGLLGEYHSDEEDEEYEEDEDEYYSKSKIDIEKMIDLYHNNEEFRNELERHIESQLEYDWMASEREEYFRKKVEEAYALAIFFAKYECSYERILKILLHNEINKILIENNSFIHVEVKYKTTTIKTFTLIRNKKELTNWLYGSFSLFSNLSVLRSEAGKFTIYTIDGDFYDYDYMCRGYFKEMKSFEVTYDGDEIKIENLVVDCVVPESRSLSMQVSIQAEIFLTNSINLKIMLSNNRLIMNVLLNFNKFYVLLEELLNIHNNIAQEPLLVCNLMLPMDVSYLDED